MFLQAKLASSVSDIANEKKAQIRTELVPAPFDLQMFIELTDCQQISNWVVARFCQPFPLTEY